MSSEPLPPQRIPPAAWISFGLGLASFGLCLLGLAGVPALVIGIRGLRAINSSDGKLRGAWLAISGMLLGGLATLTTVFGIVAILLVRVQESSKRVECINHLGKIGMGLNAFADAKKCYPAATQTPATLAPDHRLSWYVDILPLISEGPPTKPVFPYQTLIGGIDESKAWDKGNNATLARSRIRYLGCPGQMGVPPGSTHYVGLAGLGVDAPALKREDPRAGMFGHDRGVRREEVSGGISYTILVLETRDRLGSWLAGDFPTVRGLDLQEENHVGPGRSFGGLHHQSMNILWVDGSVRSVSNETPAHILRACATLRRGE
jgi:prepilin-type processing-associated H-X9-DG protein